eukprot:TRINITY_DN281_c0_g1_i10.p1 TRINITY_DN281_c0_g1~~TRINITY_DN281_c0_g1_i10.p1  ORF type:complete len:3420 (-),score=518.30 TRINITY_DN281_c0_g1_i10:122-10381(-)
MEGSVDATPLNSFIVTNLNPIASVSQSAVESTVVDGTGVIEISLMYDALVDAGSFNAQRAAILTGISGSVTTSDSWNTQVTLATSNVERITYQLLRISIPSSAGYSLVGDETIDIVVPSDVLLGNVNSTSTQATITDENPTATISGSVISDGGVVESEIVAGGETIVITVANDKIVGAGAFDAVVQAAIIAGLDGSGAGTYHWDTQVAPLINVTHGVVRLGERAVQVTLPQAAGYSLIANETVTVTLPAAALLGSTAASAVPVIDIGDEDPLTFVSGTAVQQLNESDVVTAASSKTIVIRVERDTWPAAGAPFDGVRNAIIGAMTGDAGTSTGWTTTAAGLVVGDVVRTDDRTVTVTLSGAAGYMITANETVTIAIPASALAGSAASLTTHEIVVEDLDPIATVSGSATANITESDIVTGGKAIVVTVENDMWLAAGAAFDSSRQAILDGISGDSTSSQGWDAQSPAVTSVARTSDRIITITLPPFDNYTVVGDEYLHLTVPVSALRGSKSRAVENAILIRNTAANATLTGTVFSALTETDIVSGGRTILISLDSDVFVPAGPAFDAQRAAILQGIVGSLSTPFAWNNEAIATGSVTVDDVVRNGDKLVTITLSAVPHYLIRSDETLTVTLPGSVLNGTLSAIAHQSILIGDVAPVAYVTSPMSLGIQESTVVTGSSHYLLVTLVSELWQTPGAAFDAARGDIISGISSPTSEARAWDEVAPTTLAPGIVTRVSNTTISVNFTALATYAISANETLTVTVPTTAVLGSVPLAATPSLVVIDQPPVITAGGSFLTNLTGSDVSAHGGVITLTISNDIWAVDFDQHRRSIITNITGSLSNDTAWNSTAHDVVSGIADTDVVRLSDRVLQVTIPPLLAYAISEIEIISVVVPGSAIEGASTFISGVVASVTVSPIDRPVSSLAFTVPPSGTCGVLATQPQVTAYDAQGHLIVQTSHLISLTAVTTPVGAIVSGTMNATTIRSVATYSGIEVNALGSYALMASYSSITVTSPPFTVTAGSVVSLAIDPIPNTQTGVAIPVFKVYLQDVCGEVSVSDSTTAVTVTVQSGPTGYSLGGDQTGVASAGVVSFSNLVLIGPGSYTLKFATNATGPSSTASVTITSAPRPEVDDFLPQSTPASAPQVVTITGSYFGITTSEVTAVTVAGVACQSFSWVNDSIITCTPAPVTTSTVGKVSVTTTLAGASSGDFVYLALTATSVTPSKGNAQGGTLMTITGTRLTPGTVSVTVGGTVCSNLTIVSASVLTCTTPSFAIAVGAAASQDTDVVVTSSLYGKATVTDGFTYQRHPVVTSFTPAQSPLNATDVLSIVGSGFSIVGLESVTVTVADEPCLGVTVISDTLLTCTLGSSLVAKDGLVVVTRQPSGTSASGVTPFFYIKQDQSSTSYIKSFFPNSSPSSGGVRVTITGVDLGGSPAAVTNMWLAGVSCQKTIFWNSSTTIGCVSLSSDNMNPPLRAGVVMVEIAGSVLINSTNIFTYTYPNPVLEGMAPRVGRFAGGDTVTIFGRYFGDTTPPPGSVTVTLGGQPCDDAKWLKSGEIECRTRPSSTAVPNNSTGNGTTSLESDGLQVVVVVNGRASEPRRLGFKYVADIDICTPSCTRYAECIPCDGNGECDAATCACIPGRIGLPLCLQEAIIAKADGGLDTSETDSEASVTITLTLQLDLQAGANVTVPLASSDSREGQVTTRDGLPKITFGPGSGSGSTVSFGVRGIADKVIDGNVTYAIRMGPIISSDQRLHGVMLPSLELRNTDAPPSVLHVTPALSKLNGTNVTMAIGNADVGFRLYQGDTLLEIRAISRPYARGGSPVTPVTPNNNTTTTTASAANVTSTSLSASTALLWNPLPESESEEAQHGTDIYRQVAAADGAASSPSSLDETVAIVNVSIHAVKETGYVPFRIVNPGGQWTSIDFFFTDDCPSEGMYGAGDSCRPCPTHATCPGGNRIWPDPGFWNRDETSAAVFQCNPPEACLGGRTSDCDLGYRGDFCSQCITGYAKAIGDVCEACPPDQGFPWLGLLADLSLWGLLGFAATGLEDRNDFYRVITAIMALQHLAGAGQYIGPTAPQVLRDVFGFLSIFSAEIQFFKRSCLSVDYELNYFSQVGYNFAVGLPMYIGILSYFIISRYWAKYKKRHPAFIRRRRDHFMDRLIRAATVHVSILYYGITKDSLTALYCMPKDDDYRLELFPEVVCFEGLHPYVAALALLMFCSVTIGWVAWQLWWYRKNRLRQTEFRFADRWDANYSTYSRRYFGLWIVDFIYVFALAFCDVVLSGQTLVQVFILATIIITQITITLMKWPYAIYAYNWIVGIGLNLINLTIFAFVILEENNAVGQEESDYLSYTILGGSLVCAIALIMIALYPILCLYTPKELKFTKQLRSEMDLKAFFARRYGNLQRSSRSGSLERKSTSSKKQTARTARDAMGTLSRAGKSHRRPSEDSFSDHSDSASSDHGHKNRNTLHWWAVFKRRKNLKRNLKRFTSMGGDGDPSSLHRYTEKDLNAGYNPDDEYADPDRTAVGKNASEGSALERTTLDILKEDLQGESNVQSLEEHHPVWTTRQKASSSSETLPGPRAYSSAHDTGSIVSDRETSRSPSVHNSQLFSAVEAESLRSPVPQGQPQTSANVGGTETGHEASGISIWQQPRQQGQPDPYLADLSPAAIRMNRNRMTALLHRVSDLVRPSLHRASSTGPIPGQSGGASPSRSVASRDGVRTSPLISRKAEYHNILQELKHRRELDGEMTSLSSPSLKRSTDAIMERAISQHSRSSPLSRRESRRDDPGDDDSSSSFDAFDDAQFLASLVQNLAVDNPALWDEDILASLGVQPRHAQDDFEQVSRDGAAIQRAIVASEGHTHTKRRRSHLSASVTTSPRVPVKDRLPGRGAASEHGMDIDDGATASLGGGESSGDGGRPGRSFTPRHFSEGEHSLSNDGRSPSMPDLEAIYVPSKNSIAKKARKAARRRQAVVNVGTLRAIPEHGTLKRTSSDGDLTLLSYEMRRPALHSSLSEKGGRKGNALNSSSASHSSHARSEILTHTKVVMGTQIRASTISRTYSAPSVPESLQKERADQDRSQKRSKQHQQSQKQRALPPLPEEEERSPHSQRPRPHSGGASYMSPESRASIPQRPQTHDAGSPAGRRGHTSGTGERENKPYALDTLLDRPSFIAFMEQGPETQQAGPRAPPLHADAAINDQGRTNRDGDLDWLGRPSVQALMNDIADIDSQNQIQRQDPDMRPEGGYASVQESPLAREDRDAGRTGPSLHDLASPSILEYLGLEAADAPPVSRRKEDDKWVIREPPSDASDTGTGNASGIAPVRAVQSNPVRRHLSTKSLLELEAEIDAAFDPPVPGPTHRGLHTYQANQTAALDTLSQPHVGTSVRSGEKADSQDRSRGSGGSAVLQQLSSPSIRALEDDINDIFGSDR